MFSLRGPLCAGEAFFCPRFLFMFLGFCCKVLLRKKGVRVLCGIVLYVTIPLLKAGDIHERLLLLLLLLLHGGGARHLDQLPSCQRMRSPATRAGWRAERRRGALRAGWHAERA